MGAAYFMIGCRPLDYTRDYAKGYPHIHMILSDADGAVSRAYRTLRGPGLRPDFWVVYIDRAGVVRHAEPVGELARQGQIIVGRLKELGLATLPNATR